MTSIDDQRPRSNFGKEAADFAVAATMGFGAIVGAGYVIHWLLGYAVY